MSLIDSLAVDYLNKIKLKKEILNYYKNKTIIVTGGAGAIGSNLVSCLSKIVKNGLIVVLDNLSANRSQDPFNLTNNRFKFCVF